MTSYESVWNGPLCQMCYGSGVVPQHLYTGGEPGHYGRCMACNGHGRDASDDDFYDHPHGDACCAPECCVHALPDMLPDSAEMAPPRVRGPGRLPSPPADTGREGDAHHDAISP